MAAAGRPVSELYPLGGAVSFESTLLDSSRSSEPSVSPSGLAAEPGHAPQEEPKEAFTELCKERPTTPARETNCTSLRVSEDPGERAQSCGRSSVEMHTASHRHRLAVNAISEDGSHSGSSPVVTLGMIPGGKSSQEAGGRGAPTLACKLQPCSIVTTIRRGPPRGHGSVLQPLSCCACGWSPRAEGAGTKDPPRPECDEALCCGSFVHQGAFEDTFAAHCHRRPGPARFHLLPRQVGSSCDLHCAGAPPLAMDHAALPRLFSSVSETGLDAKHLLRCCNASCRWVSALPPGAGPQSQKHFGSEERRGVQTATRDRGTMTAHKELKDVGVQTGQNVTSHVCLAEEGRSETSQTRTQTPNTDSGSATKLSGAPKSPVKEVKWDAEGMTWEVYGASVDPEELGLAIQRHLELQIKETASRAAKLTRQNTGASRQSGGAGRRRKRSRMMGPACCALSSAAVD